MRVIAEALIATFGDEPEPAGGKGGAATELELVRDPHDRRRYMFLESVGAVRFPSVLSRAEADVGGQRLAFASRGVLRRTVEGDRRVGRGRRALRPAGDPPWRHARLARACAPPAAGERVPRALRARRGRPRARAARGARLGQAAGAGDAAGRPGARARPAALRGLRRARPRERRRHGRHRRDDRDDRLRAATPYRVPLERRPRVDTPVHEERRTGQRQRPRRARRADRPERPPQHVRRGRGRPREHAPGRLVRTRHVARHAHPHARPRRRLVRLQGARRALLAASPTSA